ncbi:hypothetical protein GCM10027187_55060 [Streptosporangium sandarakinum]
MPVTGNFLPAPRAGPLPAVTGPSGSLSPRGPVPTPPARAGRPSARKGRANRTEPLPGLRGNARKTDTARREVRCPAPGDHDANVRAREVAGRSPSLRRPAGPALSQPSSEGTPA